jgi:hypothetical protein
MASLINIALGFNYNKGVMNTVVGDIGNLTKVSVGASNAISDLKDKTNLLKDIQGFAAVGNLVNNTIGAVKGLYKEIKGVFDFTDKYASKGDRIAKTSRMVGLSVHDYQAFASAAQHSGMSIVEMDDALKKFNVNLGKAKSGDAKSLKMFDAMLGGKKVSDFATSSDLIAGIADGYMKLSSAEQKAFVSQELFGRGGQKVSELFKDGGAALKDYVANYKAAFNEESAHAAEDFEDSLQDVTESFESMKTAIAIDLFPVFKELFASVKDFFESKDGDKLKETISDIAKVVVGFVKNNLPKIPKILDSIVGFVDIIGPGVAAFGVAVAAVLPFLSSIVAGFAGLVTVISGPVLLGIGLVVAAVALWGGVVLKIRDNWDMLKSFIVDDVWGGVKQFFNNCIDSVKNWVAMAIADFQWLWDGFKSIFVDPILNFIDALPQAFSDLWDGFKTGAMAAVSTVKDLLKSLPLVGNLFGDSNSGKGPNGGSTSPAAPSQIASAVQQSYSVTTNRFAVDFNNVPRGTNITPPPQGDFDWSRSYTLAGAV